MVQLPGDHIKTFDVGGVDDMNVRETMLTKAKQLAESVGLDFAQLSVVFL